MTDTSNATVSPAATEGTGAPVRIGGLWGGLHVYGLEKAADIPAEARRSADDVFAGYVAGWASFGTVDDQDEIVEPDGLEFRRVFLKRGWFNDNHSKDTCKAIGYPTLAEIREHPEHGRGLWVEGPILDTPDGRGREIVEFGKSLVGTDRSLGFSIEGPPPERDPQNHRRITRATVYNVAVTNLPVHPNAYIELLKSLHVDPVITGALHDLARVNPAGAAEVWAFLRKSMTAVAPTPNTAEGAGAAIQTESLDGGGSKPKKKRKLLTYDEAFAYLTENKIPPKQARLALAHFPRA